MRHIYKPFSLMLIAFGATAYVGYELTQRQVPATFKVPVEVKDFKIPEKKAETLSHSSTLSFYQLDTKNKNFILSKNWMKLGQIVRRLEQIQNTLAPETRAEVGTLFTTMHTIVEASSLEHEVKGNLLQRLSNWKASWQSAIDEYDRNAQKVQVHTNPVRPEVSSTIKEVDVSRIVSVNHHRERNFFLLLGLLGAGSALWLFYLLKKTEKVLTVANKKYSLLSRALEKGGIGWAVIDKDQNVTFSSRNYGEFLSTDTQRVVEVNNFNVALRFTENLQEEALPPLPTEVQAVDLSELVDDTIATLSSLFLANGIRVVCDSGPLMAAIDASEFQFSIKELLKGFVFMLKETPLEKRILNVSMAEVNSQITMTFSIPEFKLETHHLHKYRSDDEYTMEEIFRKIERKFDVNKVRINIRQNVGYNQKVLSSEVRIALTP